MIGLYCHTLGYSHDLLHRILVRLHPPSPLGTTQGILGDISPQQAQSIADEVRQLVITYFRNVCQKKCACVWKSLLARRLRYLIPVMLTCLQPSFTTERKPLAPTYQFSEQTCLESPDIQNLCADPTFLAVSQAYLRSSPVLDIVTMWWSTAFSHEASSGAAQLYHFDMASLKWLKFFVYLTDVSAENGPHCFVKGSHRSGQPYSLLRHLYSRLPDDLMRRHYAPDDFRGIFREHEALSSPKTHEVFTKVNPSKAASDLYLSCNFLIASLAPNATQKPALSCTNITTNSFSI